MPTKKVTSFVCLMLTAAMLMSSLGVGLISAPASAVFEAPAYDDGTAADGADITEETEMTTPGKYIPNAALAGGEDAVGTYGGWNSEPNASPWGNWSFRDAQNVNAQSYTGSGVTVAVADTGIDFGAQNLAGKYMVDQTTYTVSETEIVASTASGQTVVSLPHSNIVAGTLAVKLNGTASTAFTADLVRGELTFTSLPTGSKVTATYQHRPYYGWPVAFDALGLPQYLLAKEARTGGGGVANTSLNGTGPFDIDHTIRMDGQNDYTVKESACPDDKYGDVLVNGTAEGVEFDMTELWGTRDKDFWYAGIQTRYAAVNRTFGFAMDFDGAASGSMTDPHGNLLDFEASHSATIEQIAYNPVDSLLASCAGGTIGNYMTSSYETNTVKIWNVNGVLLRTLPTEDRPVFSVAWSPDGNLLAYVTSSDLVVFNADTWTETHRIVHSTTPTVQYFRECISFNSNGTVIAAGSLQTGTKIQILNLTTGFTAQPMVMSIPRSVVYSPDGWTIALGLSSGDVQLMNSTDYSLVSLLTTGDARPIETLAWSPDGSYIATGRNAGGVINIWDVAAEDNVANLTGHWETATVNAILWTDTEIISGSDEGKVMYWNPATYALSDTKNAKYNSPVMSLALRQSNGDMFVGTKDCTVRKYPSDWSAYTAFASHKPDIMVYIRFEREYYEIDKETKLKTLETEAYIEEPDVYRWNTATMSWTKTNMTNIGGNAIYKGVSAGEWTAKGFLEIALPRNFTAWPDQNQMYLNAFVCGDNSSRPQDTVPADYNVPSPSPPTYVNWQGTRKVTLSAWGMLDIPKTTIVGIPSATGTYHFGYHPSAALTAIFGLVPIVVTESTTPGVWDRVYVDMNNDYMIDSNDPYVNKAGPVLTVDVWDATSSPAVPGADGVPDLSGGMLYFIGDGKTKMPYSDRMSDVLMASGDQLSPFNVDNPMPIPRNGEIVAFFGDFNYDGTDGMITHGTQTASAIAGQGLNEGVCAPVKGVSPDVMFLPICNANYGLDYALYFAVEGYDGKVNTGDEAQIVSIGQYTSGYGSGFDEISYLVEFLVNATQSRAVFISPAGNDGSGYGTVAAPCSLNTLVVGYTEDNTYRATSTDEVQHYTVISEASSRGPTAAGLAKPDLVAVGVGEVDLPLGASGVVQTSVGGKSQTTLWTGSDLAAAVTSGTMALIFEAYKLKTGSFPTTQTALSIIKSSARDLGYDPLTQGSGFVDALAAVNLAAGTGGLSASAPKTAFGNTFGVDYGSFINVLDAGGSDTIPVTLQNPTPGTQNPTYQVEYLQRTSISEMKTLVHNSQGYRADISGMFPAEAEVIKITAQTNYTWYQPWENGTGADLKSFMELDGSFFMTLLDWVDQQSPGDSKYGIIDTNELNYLTSVDYGRSNSLTCTLANPRGSLNGSLVLEILPDLAAGSTLPSREWTITVETYTTATWAWSTLSKATSAIGTNSQDTVNVQVNVPTSAQSGTYTAAFVASYGPTYVANVSKINPTKIDETEYLNTKLHTTYWDDGTEGNHWDDWTAPDTEPDGIVDDPYLFLTEGKRDNYPLVSPVEIYPFAHSVSAPITILDNSDFAAHASRGSGTVQSPWVIEYLQIDGYGQPGIEIYDTDAFFIISNCILSNAQSSSSGIVLSNVTNGIIADCEVAMNSGFGVSVSGGSKNIRVQGLSVTDNANFGFFIDASSDMVVFDCIITGNLAPGIWVSGSNDIDIVGNEVHDQILGSGYDAGIYLDSSTACIVRGNSIYNEFYGIYLSLCQNCRVSDNTLDSFDSGSGEYSILLEWSEPVVVTGNDFTNCVALHAYDDGVYGLNKWNGNYWEEYSDVDSDSDGIWDNPYPGIDSPWGHMDNLPMVDPVAAEQSCLLPLGPISITGNADFQIVPGVTAGNGTLTNPWIIEGWSIDTAGFACGIQIENTNAHFVIKNCHIFGNISGCGITLYNAPNGVVQSNLLESLRIGIFVKNTDNSEISMNRMDGLNTGILILESGIVESSRCSVYYNTITGCRQGINVTASRWTNITRNIVTNDPTAFGLILNGSEKCSITYNTFSSNGYGISIFNSTGFNRLHHNNLLSNAIQAYDDFVGDTMASFDIFGKIGAGNFTSVYDVWFCNITRDGVLLVEGTDYTIDNDTGRITFTPTLIGWSGGAEIIISAVLVTECPTHLCLPNQRMAGAATTVKVLKADGTEETLNPVYYTLHMKSGILEFTPSFFQLKYEYGDSLVIFVNYTYYSQTSIIPLTLNVLASEVANVNYGNIDADVNALGIGIMPTWGVRPGQGAIKDSGDRLVSGDRRYFYVHVPNQGMFSISELVNFYLYNELNWDLNHTDINIIVYGKGDTSDYPTAAPYTLKKLGGSEEKPDFSFFTATGGPTDILVTPFNHEVLTICVSAKSFNGTGPSLAKFEGNSGWLRLSDKNPKEWTSDVVGHTSISFQSSLEMPGITASIVGPAQGTTSVEEIYADDLTLYDLSTLEGWLTMNAVAGFTKVVSVKNALSWDVHIMGHPMCLDLDLAIFKDGLNGEPEDGVAQWREIITKNDMEFDAYKDNYGSGSYCYCADADADEAIKIISPPDGDYIIKVLGFTLTSEPGYFDMEIKSIFAGVEGYKLSHQDTEFEDEDPSDGGYRSNEPLEGFDKRTFDILWTFPEGTEDNVYGGIFVLGIPSWPQMIVIAMDIILDREAPDILPGFTGPDTIVSSNRPTISAKVEDLANGEIDPYGASVKFDGNDVTNVASISIMNTKNSAEVKGYWTGDIIYKPASPLSEGNHHFEVEAKDKTGNAQRLSWSFTVDTTEPALVLDVPNEVYTSESTYRLTGRTEADSQISVIGVPAAINVRTDYTFDIDLELESGVNYVAIKGTDLAGNVHEVLVVITLDSETAVFTRVVALDGSTTNVRTTGIYGEMSETGTLTLNGVGVPVNSDGTFRYDTISLTEGPNMQALEFTDLAGHVTHHFMNITLDTVAPTLALDDIDSIVNDEWLNITGTTESTVTSLTINGKLVDVSSSDGSFQNNIRISPGVNTIVVESKDRAGNSATEVVTVVYEEKAGANYMAISLMVILLVVGLILGLLLAPVFLGGKEEAAPEEAPEDLPEGEEGAKEPWEEGAETVPEAAEPGTEEALPEGEEPALEETEELPEEPAEGAEDLEPIPPEEAAPEALPDDKAALEAPELAPEDPRIAKLTEAYESGKISKELYEKNLARFRGQQ